MKLFLTVDDFKPRAKKLYENLGYHCVGELPDFYKKGINCFFDDEKKRMSQLHAKDGWFSNYGV